MRRILLLSTAVAFFASCSKDKDPIIVVPPSSGSTMTLNGLTGDEPNKDGSQASNSVFVDFSTDKQTTVLRSSWDLGFFGGSDFRVVTNSSTFAMVKVTNKTDINSVGSADTVGALLAFNQNEPPLLTTKVSDLPSNDLSNTAIPAISSTENDNKVVIINRSSNNGTTYINKYVKVRILRNGTNYTLQYAPLTATTYNTVQINKNQAYDFTYVSLNNGTIVTASPEKKAWDIKWGITANQTSFTNGPVFYQFSDYVIVNTFDGVQSFKATYKDENTSTSAYSNFNKDSVSKYTFSSDLATIGSSWRTAGMTGSSVVKNCFYIVKDPAGSVYKVKFVSMGTLDGGVRGKPEIKYELIK